jgi:hypothetical protein
LYENKDTPIFEKKSLGQRNGGIRHGHRILERRRPKTGRIAAKGTENPYFPGFVVPVPFPLY